MYEMQDSSREEDHMSTLFLVLVWIGVLFNGLTLLGIWALLNDTKRNTDWLCDYYCSILAEKMEAKLHERQH